MSAHGLIVDVFAGAGGASKGIEAATGRTVDVAINHDAIALAVHAANHPATRHLVSDVWEVDPDEATGGRPVDALWASPDCTHFSVAKGGKPRKQKIRSLAWVVVRWAKAVRPRVIFLENVSEFRTWGPLDRQGHPIKARMGETFRRWQGQLQPLGYVVEWRVLDASQFGAPTRRRRLFLVARRDGQPVRWPVPTHGRGLLPVRTAAECIDWSLPCPSIFERKKPLAEKTLWRIAQGIRRFVLENPQPFIVEMNHSNAPHGADEPLGVVTTQHNRFNVVTPVLAQMSHGEGAGKTKRRGRPAHPMTEALPTQSASNDFAMIAPTLVQTSYGERKGQRPRYLNLHEPLGTVVAQGQKHALVSAFISKHFGGVVGIPATDPTSTITAKDHHSLAAIALAKFRGSAEQGHSGGADVEEPLPTITAGGIHVAEVRAFLTAYYSTDGTEGKGQDLLEPMRTVTTKARLGLVTIEGTDYQIVDIGMRMLEPHELLRAQFGKYAATYDLTAATAKAAKVRLIGNSVCPEVAEAIVRANLVDGAREEVA